MTTPSELGSELVEARGALLRELARVEPGSLTTPGLLGEWSGREILAHLGYWAGHATEAIHAVETGRADQLDADGLEVDEINATVARVARGTSLATVRRREEASVEALLERLRELEPSFLEAELPDGDTLEDAIRADGPGHYREHAEGLREALDGGARG
jgi:hypothetical protein